MNSAGPMQRRPRLVAAAASVLLTLTVGGPHLLGAVAWGLILFGELVLDPGREGPAVLALVIHLLVFAGLLWAAAPAFILAARRPRWWWGWGAAVVTVPGWGLTAYLIILSRWE